jgi:predicted Zn-dependent peptidase
MNTRLGMELREKKGIAYTIESSYNPYSDTGWFGVYFGTTENNINRAIDLIYREYNKILKNGISARELSMLQKQLTGYLIMSSENHAALVINHAKNVMYYGETFDLEQILNKIKSVNTESLLSAAHDFLQPDQQSVLIFNPAEA